VLHCRNCHFISIVMTVAVDGLIVTDLGVCNIMHGIRMNKKK
jgi:hypothetical protein